MDLTPEQLEAAEAVLREKLEKEFKEKSETSGEGRFTEEELEALVQDRVSKAKESLDKAYGKVDELTKKLTRQEEETKQLSRKQMEDEGKHLELAEMKTAELEERNKILTEQLTSLSRDQKIKDTIAGANFRNDFARQMAFETLSKSVIEDEDRGWVHKSGVPIEDYFTKVFTKDPNHSILFKLKDNSGTDADPSKSVQGTKRPDKLTGLTSEQLLEQAASGAFGEFSLD